MKYLKLLLLVTLLQTSNANEEVAEALGERLFNETRFSAFFAQASKGDVNFQLKKGSPELDRIWTLNGDVPSPFQGQAMSCASCHMVDQGLEITDLGMRGYNDAATRTPILLRKDKRRTTLRNTPTLIGINSKYIAHNFVHFDGELNGIKATVLGNFTGRNMGWLPGEKKEAIKQLLKVIREDNGLGELAGEFGGSYKKVLTGTANDIPEDFKLAPKYRLDISKATDEEIIKKVEELVFIYVKNIDFATDEDGNYNGSAYDKFLKLNGISTGPTKEQTKIDYFRELYNKLNNLRSPKFVKPIRLETHGESFGFEEKEFRGLKTFFNIQGNKRGMCVQCHMPPLFSDTLYHNIGSAQAEYEGIHGVDTFKNLSIPSLKKRKEHKNLLAKPTLTDSTKADLGAWNFFARADKPEFTNFMKDLFCKPGTECKEEELLPFMIGRIKTPTLRNLGHSAPYLHNGSAKKLSEVVKHYIKYAGKVKDRTMLNPAPQFRHMNLTESEVSDVVSFLKSLNEEYE